MILKIISKKAAIKAKPPTSPHSSVKAEKNEIGLGFGQETELNLSPLPETFTEQARRADGDF